MTTEQTPTAVSPASDGPTAWIRDLIVTSLEDDKAEDTVVIDLQGKTSLADYMIVSSGRSARQVGAMAGHLLDKLKDRKLPHVESEGMPQNDWVLIDAGDVIVHLFRPEVRAFYQIEKMWGIEPPALPASYAGPSLTDDDADDDLDDDALDSDDLDAGDALEDDELLDDDEEG